MKKNPGKIIRRTAAIVCAIAILVMLTPMAFAAQYDTLRYGSTGAQVTALQQALYDKGYLSVTPTGYYGSKTTAAVRQFQSDHGLTVDGIAGQNTQSALYGTSASSGGALLKTGSSGDAVWALQERLHALGYLDYKGATGYYGEVTRTAVVRFQKNHGLSADGIAGPVTTGRLYASDAKSMVLYPGAGGEAVSAVQSRLYRLGFYTGTVTGSYDSATKSAVVAFQQAAGGIYVDGVTGPVTHNRMFSDSAPAATASAASRIADIALAQVGKPYVLGGNGPSSYDCSGLAYYAISGAGLSVQRLSAAAYSQNTAWTKITGTSSLQKGDLVFFRSDDSSYISHMGIYAGGGEFVHASSGQGKVMVSSLTNVYWARNYMFARRAA